MNDLICGEVREKLHTFIDTFNTILRYSNCHHNHIYVANVSTFIVVIVVVVVVVAVLNPAQGVVALRAVMAPILFSLLLSLLLPHVVYPDPFGVCTN